MPAKGGGTFQVLNIAGDQMDEVLAAVKGLGGKIPRAEGGGPISGTGCSVTGPKLNPNDFNCTDSD